MPENIFIRLLGNHATFNPAAGEVINSVSVLSQMYMEEFLAESEQFIFDVGMDEMIDLVLNEDE